MNKKKILIISISALLAVVLILTIVLLATCNKGKPDGGNKPTDPDNPSVTITVGTPTNVAIDSDGIVTWTEASNAHSYELSINATIVTSLLTKYDLNDFATKPADNKYNVKVRGVAVDGTTKGDWSTEVTFTLLPQLQYATVEGVQNGIISWMLNADATAVVLTINGVEKQLDSNATNFDLSQETGDKLTITITYKGDGITYRDSKTTTVIYYPNTQSLQLPAPVNVHMEGNALVIDQVIGADVYYIRNYQNSIVPVTSNIVDMTDKYLAISVYASATNGKYTDSDEVEVTYFTKEQGKGTATEPYLISTADEFRYIEYFEGIGEAKYYELDADIVFDDIALALDQVGSNAYRFGSFSGNLDGNGNSIINLTVYYNDGYSSLFDSINDGAVIKDLVIEDANWRTWTLVSGDGIMHEKGGDVAILCHTNRGRVENITVKNSSVVAVADSASSLVAINNGTIVGCVVDSAVNIDGIEECGGVVIYNAGTVTSCVNNATVNGNTKIGGIAGRNTGLVEKCDNNGTVKGSTKIGGIVGLNDNVKLNDIYDYVTVVKYCSNNGTVSGDREIGGIVGSNGNNGMDNIGEVSITGAGVYYCYNSGTVEGVSVLGGIVGNNFASMDKDNGRGVVGCYNSGTVNLTQTVKQQYTRIYVFANENNSWITDDNAVLYCHYWGDSGSSVWPGKQMVHFMVGDLHYYYIDIPNGMLNGIKITRRYFPGNNEFNSTGDIAIASGRNLYSLGLDFASNDAWLTATSTVTNAAYDAAGAIAGYSVAVNDCYYLDTSANAVAFDNTSLQNNQILVDSNQVSSADVSKTIAQLQSQEFADLLNGIAGEKVWVKSSNGPIFSWQV